MAYNRGRGAQQGGLLRMPNMKGVDIHGGMIRIPPGEYLMELVSMKEDVSQNSGKAMVVYDFIGCEGAATDKKFRIYATLEGDTWQNKRTLTALGVEVPEDGEFDIDISGCIGAQAYGYVDDDEYQGNVRSVLKQLLIEGEQPKNPPAAVAGRAPVAGRAQAYREPAPPARPVAGVRSGGGAQTASRSNTRVVGRGQQQQIEPLPATDVNRMTADQLEQVVADYGLDLNLADFRMIGKKREAVCGKLDEAGLLA